VPSEEAALIADLRRQIAALIGQGDIPYAVELGWKPCGVLYRARQRTPDDSLPRSVLNLPVRLIARPGGAQVIPYRLRRATA
jgi:hypothetical protein